MRNWIINLVHAFYAINFWEEVKRMFSQRKKNSLHGKSSCFLALIERMGNFGYFLQVYKRLCVRVTSSARYGLFRDKTILFYLSKPVCTMQYNNHTYRQSIGVIPLNTPLTPSCWRIKRKTISGPVSLSI